MNNIAITAIALVTTALMGGCQTTAKQPATLNSQADMAVLMDTLKTALKDQSASIGMGDPLVTSQFTVLPKKLSSYETQSAAMPISFEVMTDGKTCFIQKTETDVYLLPKAKCSKL